jgi:hypothetical protein
MLVTVARISGGCLVGNIAKGTAENEERNSRLKPPKRLVTTHPLPLPINRIPDRAIRKHLIRGIIRVEALDGQRIRVPERLARIGQVYLSYPVCVALERLGDADARRSREIERAGLHALDAVAEGD